MLCPTALHTLSHLIGTLLGFQYTPLVVLKTILGIPVSDAELEAYTALWRYIGHVLGCVEFEGCVPLQSFAMSRAWMARVWVCSCSLMYLIVYMFISKSRRTR